MTKTDKKHHFYLIYLKGVGWPTSRGEKPQNLSPVPHTLILVCSGIPLWSKIAGLVMKLKWLWKIFLLPFFNVISSSNCDWNKWLIWERVCSYYIINVVLCRHPKMRMDTLFFFFKLLTSYCTQTNLIIYQVIFQMLFHF